MEIHARLELNQESYPEESFTIVRYGESQVASHQIVIAGVNEKESLCQLYHVEKPKRTRIICCLSSQILLTVEHYIQIL